MKDIKLVVLDVDGTLTDGKLYIDNNGVETKAFHVKDGMAIAQGIKNGLDILILTGRESKIVEVRAKELGITEIYQGIKDKKTKIEEVLKDKNLNYNNVAYIGDDINDLEVMKLVGYSGCPRDAVKQIRGISDLISEYNGGEGAVREIIEIILEKQGIWEKVLKKYTGGAQ
ncbi:HAD-IIIA family hydrolase [Fusobacteria bacterium ZRK30]|nr:HAD-IIIA family hydrolase [Fusobacteria bacterium ZRK30]